LHAVTDDSSARQGLWLAVGIELLLFIAACILGIVALSKRLADEPEPGSAGRSYHTDGEVTGETITYVALILVALVVIGLVSRQLRAPNATAEQESAA
jgi:Na+/proline symporter